MGKSKQIKKIKGFTPEDLSQRLQKCKEIKEQVVQIVDIFKDVMVVYSNLKKNGEDVTAFDDIVNDFKRWLEGKEDFIEF